MRVRLLALGVVALLAIFLLPGCGGEPVNVSISGPPMANTGAKINFSPNNATQDNVTYQVTVADQTGKQRGSYQVVWKSGEKRGYKITDFTLTAEELKLYTGPGPDGMGIDITSKFKVTIAKR